MPHLRHGFIAAKVGRFLRQYDTLGRQNGGYFCNGSSAVSCSGGTQVYGFTNNSQGVRSLGGCDTGFNQCLSYGYDEFNRLTSRTVTSGNAQNFTYQYDRYGNRWSQNAPQGGPAPQLTFTPANNRNTGNTYDAAGNVMSDGVNSYQYDAEGNVIQATGSATLLYSYNSLNQQVRFDYNSPTFSTYIESVFNAQGKFSANWGDGGMGGYYDDCIAGKKLMEEPQEKKFTDCAGLKPTSARSRRTSSRHNPDHPSELMPIHQPMTKIHEE